MKELATISHLDLGSPTLPGKCFSRQYGEVELSEKLISRWRERGFTLGLVLLRTNEGWIAIDVAKDFEGRD